MSDFLLLWRNSQQLCELWRTNDSLARRKERPDNLGQNIGGAVLALPLRRQDRIMGNVNVLVVFYSRNGNTAALAEAIAEGARSEGAEVTLRRTDEFLSEQIIANVPGWTESREKLKAKYSPPTPDDAANADAIVWGTPTRFGNVSAELKAYIDSLGGLWAKGALANKVGSAFTSTSSLHGGNESTTITLFNVMAHFGMIMVPPGYTDPIYFQAGTPYGASSVSGANSDQMPTENDLAAARHQGKRVAQIAKKLKGEG
jgi:NAD(P)H dehydrogenase (quinone)